jgi:DeoR family transcriptional regulator, fructose operon transcriptional repressor
MLPAERHRHILALLDDQISVRISHLKERLGVNEMMLWRDLKRLEEQGLIKRIRGGAMRADVGKEPCFSAKLESARAAKERLAAYAAHHFVADGDILALESGTTVTNMVHQLSNRNLTILTNGLPVLNAVRSHTPAIAAYCSGGLLRDESGTFVGKESITFFSRRKVNTFFMSASGLEPTLGISDPNPQEIEVKHAMARSADRVILLIDSSKFGKASLMQALHLRRVDCVLCEKEPDPEYRALFEQNEVELIVV